jgi:hypothetical protein
VPRARLNNGRLALAEDARLPVAFDGQLAIEGREALDDRSVAVLASNARPNGGGELGDCAARRVRPGKLQERGALTGKRDSPKPRRPGSA